MPHHHYHSILYMTIQSFYNYSTDLEGKQSPVNNPIVQFEQPQHQQ